MHGGFNTQVLLFPKSYFILYGNTKDHLNIIFQHWILKLYETPSSAIMKNPCPWDNEDYS